MWPLTILPASTVTPLLVCSQHCSAVEPIKCHHQSDHIIPLLKTFQAPTTTQSKPLHSISLTQPRPPCGYDALASGVWNISGTLLLQGLGTCCLLYLDHHSLPTGTRLIDFKYLLNMSSSKHAHLHCPRQCYFFHGIY